MKLKKKCNEKRAVYHKKCRNRYDNQHFERANKRQKLSAEPGNSSSSTPSTKTRSHFQAQNFQNKCFLCGAVTKESLHQVQTFKLDQHVRDAAERLMDEELLAKLSEGDLVATEACYHSTCLTTLYNKVRIINSSKSENEKRNEILEGIAIAEVVAYIRQCLQAEDKSVPVFQLKQLKDLYTKRLLAHGYPLVYEHSTRFKEKY